MMSEGRVPGFGLRVGSSMAAQDVTYFFQNEVKKIDDRLNIRNLAFKKVFSSNHLYCYDKKKNQCNIHITY